MASKEVLDLRENVTIMTPKQGLTEDDCIKKFNKALKNYLDSDSDEDGIIFIEIEIEEAERLFNDLFENATFTDYLETYEIDTEEKVCDISPMWGLLCNVISDEVLFNRKTKELFKPQQK